MRSPWANPTDPHMIGEIMDFTENDLREIERDRDLPPDEPYPCETDNEAEVDDDE